MTSIRVIVLSGPEAGREDEYNDWYDNRHLHDVLTVRGFRAAQRFRFQPTSVLGPDAPYEYLAIYEVEGMTAAEAEAALIEAASDPERMPRSDAMAKPRATWFFESLGERLTASAPAG